METTGRLIAKLQRSLGSSTFQTAARRRWDVDFEDSDIPTILTKLEQLKHNMQHTTPIPCNAYKITVGDVVEAEAILTELFTRWKQRNHLPPPAKLYDFLDRLREMEAITPEQLVERTVNKLTKPKPSPKLSKEEQEKAEFEAFLQRRALDMMKDTNKKS